MGLVSCGGSIYTIILNFSQYSKLFRDSEPDPLKKNAISGTGSLSKCGRIVITGYTDNPSPVHSKIKVEFPGTRARFLTGQLGIRYKPSWRTEGWDGGSIHGHTKIFTTSKSFLKIQSRICKKKCQNRIRIKMR